MDGTVEAFLGVAETHAKYGTTAMVPTTLTSTNEELMTTFTVYRKAKEMNINGSQFIGLHLEGPYFSPKQCVYVPKTFHLIGSPAYESSGNMVLGTAEGGKKITLYNVNDLNVKKINIEKLNDYYFETMHHEFAHILHQKRNFDPSFNRISEGKYVGADWYYYMTAEGKSSMRPRNSSSSVSKRKRRTECPFCNILSK